MAYLNSLPNHKACNRYFLSESAAFVAIAFIGGKTRCVQFFPDTTFRGLIFLAYGSTVGSYCFHSQCYFDRGKLFKSMVLKMILIGTGIFSFVGTLKVFKKGPMIPHNVAFKIWGMESIVAVITHLWQRADGLNKKLIKQKNRFKIRLKEKETDLKYEKCLREAAERNVRAEEAQKQQLNNEIEESKKLQKEAEQELLVAKSQLQKANKEKEQAEELADRLRKSIDELQASRNDGSCSLFEIVIDEPKIQEIKSALLKLEELKTCDIKSLTLNESVRSLNIDKLLNKYQNINVYSENFDKEQLFILHGQQVISDKQKTDVLELLESSQTKSTFIKGPTINLFSMIYLKIRLWEIVTEQTISDKPDDSIKWISSMYQTCIDSYKKSQDREKFGQDLFESIYINELFSLEGQVIVDQKTIDFIKCRLRYSFSPSSSNPVHHYTQSIVNIILFEKYLWKALPEGKEKINQKVELQNWIKLTCERFVDAYQNCEDQVSGQLESIAIEAATRTENQAKVLSGLCVMSYKNHLVKELISKNLPQYQHQADVERQLQEAVTTISGLPRPEIQKNISYKFANNYDLNVLLGYFSETFFPEQYLVKQLGMGGDRKLYTMMAKWYSVKFFSYLDNAHDCGDYYRQLKEAIGCDPEMIGFNGKDFNDQAKLYFLTQNNILNSPL